MRVVHVSAVSARPFAVLLLWFLVLAFMLSSCGGGRDNQRLANEELVMNIGLKEPLILPTDDPRVFEYEATNEQGVACKGKLTIPLEGKKSEDFVNEMTCVRPIPGLEEARQKEREGAGAGSEEGKTETGGKKAGTGEAEGKIGANTGKLDDPFGEMARGCDGGDLAQCTEMGELLWRGPDAFRDGKRARRVHVGACEKGSQASCTALGTLFRRGVGGAKDFEKGNAIFEDSCQKGHQPACTKLALAIYVDGDHKRAATMLDDLCTKGDLTACDGLAEAYRMGHGVKRDEKKARAMFEKTCNGGELQACVHLGEMYEKGWGGNRSVSRAKELYDLACEDGLNVGCRYAERLGP